MLVVDGAVLGGEPALEQQRGRRRSRRIRASRRRATRGTVPLVSRTRRMMAERTSASSGLTTRSRSASVLEGAICSSGTSSPVVGQPVLDQAVVAELEEFLDADARERGGPRRPPMPRTRGPLPGSRSRRLPVAGSSAQILPVPAVCGRAADQGLARGGEGLARAWPAGRPAAVPAAVVRRAVDGADQDRQDRQPFAGARVHARLAAARGLAPADLLLADGAGRRPTCAQRPGSSTAHWDRSR